MIWEHWAPEVLPDGAGGVLGSGRIGSGVGCLRRLGGGAPVHLCPQIVWRFFAVPIWQGRHPAVWFCQSIAASLAIAAFTISCPRKSTPSFLYSWTLARGNLIRYCISSNAAHENPPLAISAIFKARHMSDCSRCSRPPFLAIVADMLKTYNGVVAASNNENRRLPQPYMPP